MTMQEGTGGVNGGGDGRQRWCEHVFVSIKGSPYARFRRAVETDSATLATAAARPLPQLTLADALRLCLLYARRDPAIQAFLSRETPRWGTGRMNWSRPASRPEVSRGAC